MALGAVLLVGLLALVGCQNHPDDKQAVYTALSSHDLRSVEVFQNRRKGEMTLRGIVATNDTKTQALNLAQQVARLDDVNRAQGHFVIYAVDFRTAHVVHFFQLVLVKNPVVRHSFSFVLL